MARIVWLGIVMSTTLPAYWMSILTAMIGAILVLAVYKLIKGKWMRT